MKQLKDPETLEALRREKPILIVQFGADTCGPCRALRERLRRWEQTHPGVFCLYVSVPDFPALCAQMGVFTVPVISVYVQGRLTLQQSGCFSLDQMLQQVEKYRRLLEE